MRTGWWATAATVVASTVGCGGDDARSATGTSPASPAATSPVTTTTMAATTTTMAAAATPAPTVTLPPLPSAVATTSRPATRPSHDWGDGFPPHDPRWCPLAASEIARLVEAADVPELVLSDGAESLGLPDGTLWCGWETQDLEIRYYRSADEDPLGFAERQLPREGFVEPPHVGVWIDDRSAMSAVLAPTVVVEPGTELDPSLPAVRAFYVAALDETAVIVILQVTGPSPTTMAAARRVGEALVAAFGDG